MTLFPNLDIRLWILAAGRLLSQIGIGFTLFYAPLFFTDDVGLSATAIGLGLGSQSVSGMFGRFAGGSMADSPRWGRRRTLLISAAISAVADGCFVITNDFTGFVIANLLMGLGVGLYWPATEAVVADLTTVHNRNEAFAIVRLADSLGLSAGVVLGGAMIAAFQAYRLLFALDGITFIVFYAIVAIAITETLSTKTTAGNFWQGWQVAMCDRTLQIYVVVNSLFTLYLSQSQSTLPLYLNRFTSLDNHAAVGGIFTWAIVLTAFCQLPMARWLKRFAQPHALMIALAFWAFTFFSTWLVGQQLITPPAFVLIGLTTMALGTVAYTPIASALVVGIAPKELRGVYLSVNSMCWAVGYLIGPPLGGWALDHTMAHQFWLWLMASTLGGVLILRSLQLRMQSQTSH
ncbi:arabinose efflux permease family protein [Leptolyngbya sp. Heron Island J]|uniref:MFS transporter n=1 Tax=Leptolyngbya sp. Heron Island J TaxID=1385935 RepID=UPI0003B97366|nr:MFS transporter [Leptolyngbya sp. Heron Island J]ESA34461.1 arabinose efflux permease family protein [Leptolyngbya sp. Heron Island J]